MTHRIYSFYSLPRGGASGCARGRARARALIELAAVGINMMQTRDEIISTMDAYANWKTLVTLFVNRYTTYSYGR